MTDAAVYRYIDLKFETKKQCDAAMQKIESFAKLNDKRWIGLNEIFSLVSKASDPENDMYGWWTLSKEIDEFLLGYSGCLEDGYFIQLPPAFRKTQTPRGTDKEQKDILRDILRTYRFLCMDDAKNAIMHLLGIAVLRCPTFNDLAEYLKISKLEFGDDWGWPNLYWDMLSNKYGAVAKRGSKNQVTRFYIQLPVPEKIMTNNKEEK